MLLRHLLRYDPTIVPDAASRYAALESRLGNWMVFSGVVGVLAAVWEADLGYLLVLCDCIVVLGALTADAAAERTIARGDRFSGMVIRVCCVGLYLLALVSLGLTVLYFLGLWEG